MKNIFASILLAGIVALSSCSKSNGPATPKGETAEFTFTVAVPANAPNGITIAIGGVDPTNTKNTNLWKVNGVAQGSQIAVALDGSYFPAGKTTTVTIESQVPLIDVNVDFSLLVFNPPYVVTYTPVINGATVQGDALSNFSVTGTLDKNFAYNQQ